MITLPYLTEPPGAYAGVGSRETPDDVLALMVRIAEALAARGWTLRSGCATGADTAFEVGAPAGAAVELYQPWPTFGLMDDGNPIPPLRRERIRLGRPSPGALKTAERYHPHWPDLPQSSRNLHARNVHQVLGADLRSPSRFVVCWTPDGADGVTVKTSSRTGGTGQAIRIAAAYDVFVWNLRCADQREAWEALVR